MPTVAPIRKVDKSEDLDWYTKLVEWWGFDPMDLIPVAGVVTKGKKASKVGKAVREVLAEKKAKGRVKPVSPTEVSPFEMSQVIQGGRTTKPAQRLVEKTPKKTKQAGRLEDAKKSGIMQKDLKKRGYYIP